MHIYNIYIHIYLHFSRGDWILNSEKGGVNTVDGSEIPRPTTFGMY